MIQLIAHDGAGRILFLCTCPDGLTPMPFDGRIYRPWSEPFSLVPPTPTSEAFFLDGRPQWVETGALEQAKAAAWAAAKIERDKAEAAPFEFAGNLYDPNKINLTGAALRALMAQLAGVSITRTWTLADNSEVVLTGDQLIGAGAILADRVDAIHEHGRALRKLIDNATTPAEAYGYTWNSLDA
jgi:hypothetical protein